MTTRTIQTNVLFSSRFFSSPSIVIVSSVIADSGADGSNVAASSVTGDGTLPLRLLLDGFTQ